eukprot:scpid5250/ scgid4543/ 
MSGSCRVRKCGWLMKQSGVMKSWSKRWFILYEDGRLVFYKSPADWSNQGVTIDLAVCATVQDRVAFGAKGLAVDWPTGVLRECCFVIATQTRPVYLYGTNKDEASAWLVTLQHAMLKAVANAEENPASRVRKSSYSPDVKDKRRYSTSIDKLRRRFSTASKSVTSNAPDQEDLASDASEGDSLSVHSSHSGGMMLEDDVDSRSMVSYVSGTSLGTMHSSQSAGSRSHAKSSAASKESTTLLSCHSAKASYGLSKHRLPPQVGHDVQESLPPLVRAMGSINAVTGYSYTFLCNFGEVYKSVSWHLTGAGKQAAADKERVGTIVHEKYLLPLSHCIVEMCEDSEQKQTFVQRTWKRLIEFQCRQSPFQESGCHAADCWLDGGILHVAVLAQYFGELPFQPLPLSIPEVNGANQPLIPSFDSGVASAGDLISRSSSHDKASVFAEEVLAESLKEDISKGTQLLQVALQVMSDATKVPFTFECEFASLAKIVDQSLISRLASIVYNDYLMAISAIIVDYCEDRSCRDDLVRNVHSRRIVLIVDDEEQLVKNWAYLVPLASHKDSVSLEQCNGGRGDQSPETESSDEGGQVVCRDGVLYLLVPLQIFSKEQFNPSLDVFEARRPKDECSRLNNYVSSYATSKKLPAAVCHDIMDASARLEKSLETLSRKLEFDILLECNFESLYASITSTSPESTESSVASGESLPPVATTVYCHYVAVLCKRLVKYVEEVTERSSLLQRQIYNQKISFQLVTRSIMQNLLKCPQQFPLGGRQPSASSNTIGAAEGLLGTFTFLHRGVLRVVCLPEAFGQGRFDIKISNLPSVPDNVQVRCVVGPRVSLSAE